MRKSLFHDRTIGKTLMMRSNKSAFPTGNARRLDGRARKPLQDRDSRFQPSYLYCSQAAQASGCVRGCASAVYSRRPDSEQLPRRSFQVAISDHCIQINLAVLYRTLNSCTGMCARQARISSELKQNVSKIPLMQQAVCRPITLKALKKTQPWRR